jgi:uncharacterized protein (TIGR03086 family)
MTFSARDHYQHALDGVDVVVAGATPGSWDAPSPCPGWTARDVLGHLIDGQIQIESLLSGKGHRVPAGHPGAVVGSAPPTDVWAESRRAIDAVLARLAGATSIATPMGLRTAAEVLGMAVIEPLVHAWDLATATGQVIRLDPDAVAVTLAGVRALGGQLAATGMFAPAQPVPADAGPQSELLALVGRHP